MLKIKQVVVGVVLIVCGLLSLTSYANLQNPLIKAQLGSAMTAVAVVKQQISEYFITNGIFPDSNEAIHLSSQSTSPYIEKIAITKGGVIEITLKIRGLSKNQMQFVPKPNGNSGSITWQCNGKGTTVEKMFLPKACQ